MTSTLAQPALTGIAQLSKEVSVGAFYDSAECSPPERHSETQNAALEEVYEWINASDQDKNVLWLHGLAGVGKSAVSQTIAERCAQSKQLVASFFFSRETPGCDSAKLLWATIAFQIAMCSPALRSKIGQAMEDDPTICQKSLMKQLQKLIIDPFSSLESKAESTPGESKAENPLGNPFLVVIDGLDECQMHAEQRDILRSVANIIATHHLPLRFLIASRREGPIPSEFDSPIFRYHCHRIRLDQSSLPAHDHDHVSRPTSDSRWQPFYHPDQSPTPTFITLLDDIFTYLDPSNLGYLIPETYTRFLDDMAVPLKDHPCMYRIVLIF
jgi:hypothetical protein